MPDWAIVLFAAFVGGLAGAVLQPVVTFWLQRMNSGKEIRKRRERSLRRMLNSAMERGRHIATGAMRALYWADAGLASTDLKEIKDLLDEVPEYVWQPERIEDHRLRELADEYDENFRDLTLSLSQGLDREAVRHLGKNLFELQQQITRRMDELNWPEVED